MLTFLKIAVLLLCAAVSVVLSCRSVRKQGTCHLLSFFVAAGVTTFFSDDKVGLSLLIALVVFATMFVLTTILSHKTTQRKSAQGNHKAV